MDSATGRGPVYSPPAALLSYHPAEGYVFAALPPGVARYDGYSWSLVNTGLPAGTIVNQIAVDPFNPATLLIATDRGIYRTDDALSGCAWSQVLLTPTQSIAEHPFLPGTFYAGAKAYGGVPPLFLATSDGGTHWTAGALDGGDLEQPSAICVGPPAGQTIYIADLHGGFWRSTDGGAQFQHKTNAAGPFQACAVHNADAARLFLAAPAWFTGNVARSTDGGESWSYVEPETGRQYTDVGADPYNGWVWVTDWPNPGRVLWAESPWTATVWLSTTLGNGPRAVDFGPPGTVWVGGARDNQGKTHVWVNEGNGSGPWLDRGISGLGTGDVKDLAPLARYYYALVSPTISLVEVAPDEVTADGLATATITVTVLRAQGQPVPDVSVVLQDDGLGTTLTQPATRTNDLGQAFGAIRGTRGEVVHVRAWAAGAELGEQATVTFVGPDLAVDKAGPAYAAPGTALTYTLEVRNEGRLVASGVALSDTLPAEVEFVTHSASFPFSRDGQVLTWQVGDLAAGAGSSWTVRALLPADAPQGALLENVAVAGSPAAEHDTQNNRAALTTRVLDALEVQPSQATLSAAGGGSVSLAVTVRNDGATTLHGLSVVRPLAEMPWLSADRTDLGDLAAGGDTTFTVTAAPPTTTLPGYFQGQVVVHSLEGAQAGLPLTVYVAGNGPVGALAFHVRGEEEGPVAGAALTLISTTGALSFRNQADAGGAYTFTGIPQGVYNYQVTAPGYSSLWGQYTVTGGIAQVNVQLAGDYADYDWTVYEGEISDTYDILLTITYRLAGRPILVPCGPWLEVPLHEESYTGQYCLHNPSDIPLQGVHVDRGTLDERIAVSFPDGGNLGVVTDSITLTATFTRSPGVTFTANYAAGDLHVEGSYSDSRPFETALHVVVNPTPTLSCFCWEWGDGFYSYCRWPGHAGGGGGGGGSGPPSPPYDWDPVFITPPGRVRLRLSQSAMLSRQAFWADLELTSRGERLLTVTVDLAIVDEQGSSAADKFTVDDSQAQWTQVGPGETVPWHWTIVPKACAVEREAAEKDYYVYADVSFHVAGSPTALRFGTPQARIGVHPQPRLFLYYYLPARVRAHERFSILVAAQNWAYGPADSLRFGVPQFTVDPPSVTLSMVAHSLDLGTLGPQDLGVGYVDLLASAEGTITYAQARLSQRDFQGLKLSPLIVSVTTFLVQDDRVEVLTRTRLPDLEGAACARPGPPPDPGLVMVRGWDEEVVAFPGETVTHTYTVYNLNPAEAVSISLAASSEHGWPATVSDTVWALPGRGVVVPVRLAVPAEAPYGRDLETLRATYVPAPRFAHQDGTTTLVSAIKILGIEVLPATTLEVNDDGWYLPNPLTYRAHVVAAQDLTIDGELGLNLPTSEEERSALLSFIPLEQPGHGWTGQRWTCWSASGAAHCVVPIEEWHVAAREEQVIDWQVWVKPMLATTIAGYVAIYWENPNNLVLAEAPDVAVPRAAIHPVIVIPGGMGTFPPAQCGPFPPTLDPIEKTYVPLHEYLEMLGYKQDVSLFDFPYNWLTSVTEDVGPLEQRISGIKTMPGPTYVDRSKVDFVTHSMGGLVARAYIEREDYADDVHSLITLATPHQGIPVAYLGWEGNDLTWALEETRWALRIIAWARGYCPGRRWVPIPRPHWEPYCTAGDLQRFIQTELPSVRDVLPTEDVPVPYLVAYDDPLNTYPITVNDPLGNGWPENPFLKDLNSPGGPYDLGHLISAPGLTVSAAYNTSYLTFFSFPVMNCFNEGDCSLGPIQVPGTDPLWMHGIPFGQNAGRNRGLGDGLVPQYSAQITTTPGLERLNAKWVDGAHQDIPKMREGLRWLAEKLLGVLPPHPRVWQIGEEP